MFVGLRQNLSQPYSEAHAQAHACACAHHVALGTRLTLALSLTRQFFGLKDPLQSVSPVVIGRGDTKVHLYTYKQCKCTSGGPRQGRHGSPAGVLLTWDLPTPHP